MEELNVDQKTGEKIVLGPTAGNWRLVAVMFLSGLVAIASGTYLLTA